jgi:peroxidase
LQAQKRLTQARYEDETGDTVYSGGADPTDVARNLFDQDGGTENTSGVSAFFTTFGQFLDHDLVITPEGDDTGTIDLAGMPHGLHRSSIATDTGEDDARAPANAVTWQLDGSQVYGSTAGRETDLRAFEDGKLKMGDDVTSTNGQLPDANPDTVMAGDIDSDDPVHLAGDVRANENPNLLSMQTLFVREHNYWAERLAEEHPDWDDQQLFDGARQIVEYELQEITYNEWLPHLIGDNLPDYTGHDPDADGQVSVEFSTAAFRFGHTLVTDELLAQNDDGTDAARLGLFEGFFNQSPVEEHGTDAFIRGQLSTTAEELDTKIVDSLNFFLETPDGLSGFSLAALNLARGLDHGLQSYVDTRAALIGDIDPAALDPDDFSIITNDPALQAELASVYDSVHDVDLWVGGLAEDALPGAQMGPLFTHIIVEQFDRTRAADEGFGTLDPALGTEIIAEVQASGMADVISRNTDIDLLQADPFLAQPRELTDADAPEGTWANDEFPLVAQDINDDVLTKSGDDTVEIIGGTQIAGDVDTGAHNDTVAMSSGDIAGSLFTRSGDDTVSLTGTARVAGDVDTGWGDDDVILDDMAQVDGNLRTHGGDDTVTVGGKASVAGVLGTGKGSDTVEINDQADVGLIRTGMGDDTIKIGRDTTVDKVNGGMGFDRLEVEGPYRVDWGPGGPDSGQGTIVYLDADGAKTGKTLAFTKIEMITCFTTGTHILTQIGQIKIEDLNVGDMVWTQDAGLQPIRWIGRTTVQATGDLAPVRIAKDTLGNSRDLVVSPQHRMMLSDWRVSLYTAQDEVLLPAISLVNDTTITRDAGGFVTYFHMCFDDHQIVMAEGIPSESFLPAAQSLKNVDAAAQAELLRLFPELATGAAIKSARPILTRNERQLIARLS